MPSSSRPGVPSPTGPRGYRSSGRDWVVPSPAGPAATVAGSAGRRASAGAAGPSTSQSDPARPSPANSVRSQHYGVTALASAAHHRHQQPVGFVGGGHKPTPCLIKRGTVDPGDNAAGGPAQSDAGREVHAAGEVSAIGDIRGAPAGSDPASASVVDTTRGRKRSTKPGWAGRSTARNPGAPGNGGSRLTSTSRVAGEGVSSASSAPPHRTRATVPSVTKTSPLSGSTTAAAPYAAPR